VSKLELEVQDIERRLKIERSVQSPAKNLHELFKSGGGNDIMAARAKEEFEIATKLIESLEKELEQKSLVWRLARGTFALSVETTSLKIGK